MVERHRGQRRFAQGDNRGHQALAQEFGALAIDAVESESEIVPGRLAFLRFMLGLGVTFGMALGIALSACGFDRIGRARGGGRCGLGLVEGGEGRALSSGGGAGVGATKRSSREKVAAPRPINTLISGSFWHFCLGGLRHNRRRRPRQS
jgi:hypothetical protein